MISHHDSGHANCYFVATLSYLSRQLGLCHSAAKCFHQEIFGVFCKKRQSKQCGFSIYTFDNLKSKSMVRLVRAEKMVLSGLVFARKIAKDDFDSEYIGFDGTPDD